MYIQFMYIYTYIFPTKKQYMFIYIYILDMSSLRCKQKPSTAFAARSIPSAPHCFFANLPIQYLLSFEEMLLPILSTRGDPCAAEEALGFSYDPISISCTYKRADSCCCCCCCCLNQRSSSVNVSFILVVKAQRVPLNVYQVES